VFGSTVVWVLVLLAEPLRPVGYFKDRQACIDAVKQIIGVQEADSSKPAMIDHAKARDIQLEVEQKPIPSLCVPVEKPLKD
jgi:hypothetical protein